LSCATPRYFFAGATSELRAVAVVSLADGEVLGEDAVPAGVRRVLEALAAVVTDVGETGCA
jgi:hypothetical protein